MSLTRRPERRNRNIGTAAAGHGQNNKMRIPLSGFDGFGGEVSYYERVTPKYVVNAQIGSSKIAVMYEEPRKGFTYGCTPKDVIRMLSLLPDDDVWHIDIVVFRQPTRKQAQQSPVWGRLQYLAVVGSFIGPCIYIEAFEIGSSYKWPRKLGLSASAELQRLRDDGHLIEDNQREYIITPTEASIRRHILYRTLPHEVGHWVQYSRETLDRDTAIADDLDLATELYFSKPSAELESFAHRYADDQSARLRRECSIPFHTLG